MNSASLKGRTQLGANNFDVGAKFGLIKLARAILRGALILAAIVVLVLITAGPAQGQTGAAAAVKHPKPSETVLYDSHGGGLGSGLIFDGFGNIYGTSIDGGVGPGSVFELSPNGSGGWNETTLYTFPGGGVNGSYPMSPVIFDSVGNLYGTT